MGAKNNIFTLKEKIKETDDVATLKFTPLNDEIFSFRPGQFVMIRLPNNKLSDQSKAYTISSSPGEKFLAITVKKTGKFSEALCNLKIGDKVQTSGPQGFFCPDKSIGKLVFLAGGVGITPFYSIIKNCLLNNSDKKNIYLFYSNKTKNDIVFFKDLENLSSRFKNFKVVYFLTQEKVKHPRIKEFQRINVDILKKYLKNLEEKYYFICGPIGFVNDLWSMLKKAGIKEEEIFTEAFY